jgi:hypothetical protein
LLKFRYVKLSNPPSKLTYGSYEQPDKSSFFNLGPCFNVNLVIFVLLKYRYVKLSNPPSKLTYGSYEQPDKLSCFKLGTCFNVNLVIFVLLKFSIVNWLYASRSITIYSLLSNSLFASPLYELIIKKFNSLPSPIFYLWLHLLIVSYFNILKSLKTFPNYFICSFFSFIFWLNCILHPCKLSL